MSPEGESLVMGMAPAPGPLPLCQDPAGDVPASTFLNFALNLECLECLAGEAPLLTAA